MLQGFDVKKPPRAILDFYGAKDFQDVFWTSPIQSIVDKLPKNLPQAFLDKVYEGPVPIWGGVSLEGQAQPGPPRFDDPRQAFALSQIGHGTLLQKCQPQQWLDKIDPIMNISSAFPPTYIVHGLADEMIPIEMSRKLLTLLREKGVRCGMVEIPGEPHTFVARMAKGSQTWTMQRRGFDFLQDVIEGR